MLGESGIICQIKYKRYESHFEMNIEVIFVCSDIDKGALYHVYLILHHLHQFEECFLLGQL